jgi:hypothetical protein
MAYLDQVILPDLWQTGLTAEELKAQKHGVIEAVQASTAGVDYLLPSYKNELSQFEGQHNFKIPVLIDDSSSVVVSTSPGFSSIPVNLGEGAYIQPVNYNVFSGFRLFPSTFGNGKTVAIDIQSYIANRIKTIGQAMAKSVETILLSVLAARKTQALDFVTQISQGAGTFTFNGTDDQLEVAKAAQTDAMFQKLNELMDANKLGGNYRIVTSPAGLTELGINAYQYGANNSKNLVQFESAMPIDRRHQSHQISPASDVFQGYLLRDGSIGMYETFMYDFIKGTNFAGKNWSVADMPLPFVNMRPNVFTNVEATDSTSLFDVSDNNHKMATYEEMAFWISFWVIYRYNSDITTIPNDIVKIVGKTS